MKRTCIVAAALIALTSLYFGVPFRTEASGTGKELDEIVFYMERGASVRMAEGTKRTAVFGLYEQKRLRSAGKRSVF